MLIQDEKFLVPVPETAGLFLKNLMLHLLSDLPVEEQDRILGQAKARGGLIDLRIVFEGAEYKFLEFNTLLTQAYERTVQQGIQRFLDDHLEQMRDKLRESLDTFVPEFGNPEEDYNET